MGFSCTWDGLQTPKRERVPVATLVIADHVIKLTKGMGSERPFLPHPDHGPKSCGSL